MKISSWLLVFVLAVTVINYPNPFNPAGGEVTTIECTVDTTTEATLYIYNLAAQMVASKPFTLNAGATNRTAWSGYTDYNELSGSGIYLYQIIDASHNRVGKGKIWVINQ
jgi:hypothetical protein